MDANIFLIDEKKQKTIRYKIKYCLVSLWAAYIKLCLNLFRPKRIEKKYKVSICAIFRNESPYLKEWIEYHRIIGIEHFYLYNRKSEDDFYDVLKPYIEDDIVTLIDWPYERAQIPSYRNCIENFRDESNWIGFIDLDEFVVPIRENNIYDFLKQFEKNRPAVLIYWKMFGTSGMLNRDLNRLVTESFTVSSSKYRDIGKCFWNTAYAPCMDYEKKNGVLHHFFWSKIGSKMIPPVNAFDHVCYSGVRNKVDNSRFPIQINHYFNKSLWEYINLKANKGDVYNGKFDTYTDEYFFAHEAMNDSCDYAIYKYLVKLKLAMAIENQSYAD